MSVPSRLSAEGGTRGRPPTSKTCMPAWKTASHVHPARQTAVSGEFLLAGI